MPRRKQARRANVKDLRSILRLSYEQGLSVRAISERLQLSKTTVSTYLLRAYSDEAGHLFRHEAGHRTDLKPATIPT